MAVLDLVTGVQVGQWWHEARIDWLELNESGQLLLFRDTRRRLALLRLDNGDKVGTHSLALFDGFMDGRVW